MLASQVGAIGLAVTPRRYSIPTGRNPMNTSNYPLSCPFVKRTIRSAGVDARHFPQSARKRAGNLAPRVSNVPLVEPGQNGLKQ